MSLSPCRYPAQHPQRQGERSFASLRRLWVGGCGGNARTFGPNEQGNEMKRKSHWAVLQVETGRVDGWYTCRQGAEEALPHWAKHLPEASYRVVRADEVPHVPDYIPDRHHLPTMYRRGLSA